MKERTRVQEIPEFGCAVGHVHVGKLCKGGREIGL